MAGEEKIVHPFAAETVGHDLASIGMAVGLGLLGGLLRLADLLSVGAIVGHSGELQDLLPRLALGFWRRYSATQMSSWAMEAWSGARTSTRASKGFPRSSREGMMYVTLRWVIPRASFGRGSGHRRRRSRRRWHRPSREFRRTEAAAAAPAAALAGIGSGPGPSETGSSADRC